MTHVTPSPEATLPEAAIDLTTIGDAGRLHTLDTYQIIDTDSEEAYDDIARLAAHVCAAPAAFITFVDGDHQFFKAGVGAGETRTALLHSGFCPFTVARQDVLVIPDARADRRYAQNAVVTEAPFVRAYAGVPVRSPEGHVLGTVCVVDQKPREFGPEPLGVLQALARQVEALLSLRRMVIAQTDLMRDQARLIVARDTSSAARELAERERARAGEERERGREELHVSEQRFRALADNIAQLAWMTDASGWIFWYNRRWFEYTGTTLEEMQGWGWGKVHHPDYLASVTEKFRVHLVSGEPWEDTFPLRGADGQYRFFLSRAFPIRDDTGRIVLWCGTNTDITQQMETEAALKRAEGRVKSLYELTSRTDIGFTEKVDRLLHAGREWLDLEGGIFASIDPDNSIYKVVQINARNEAFPVGFTCPLEQTFCFNSVHCGPNSPPLAIEHASASSEWCEHPAYKTFGCEAYLGAVIRVGDRAWGTLSFFSDTPHRSPFTAFDTDIVRLMAQWVGGEIARQEAETALRTHAVQQRRFVREMLASVTEGKLCLCDILEDLPPPLLPASEIIDLTPAALRILRKRVDAVAENMQLPKERCQDLLTAVGEAGMNAIKHGGGGTGRVHADFERGVIQVRITDHGTGIREEDLHRATLEKGWSGAGSLGHGFYLMLRTVDRTCLLTGPLGTTVVLEQELSAPLPAWLQVECA